ncbi:unnamed protein product [Rodentolepis nana]|uniref:WD_REPEATS_REGION domain-containing protein n=1 Tax=Rodentolepis nana TaxID=102285 RepID=A0A0R3TEF1_RODNA|nr:unnamed protein product [Rodentolepis nana]
MNDSAWKGPSKDMGASESSSLESDLLIRHHTPYERVGCYPRWKDYCRRRIEIDRSWAFSSDFDVRKLKLKEIFNYNQEVTCIKTCGEWILCGLKWDTIMVYDCKYLGSLIGVIVGPPGIARKFLVAHVLGRIFLATMTNSNEIHIYDLTSNKFVLHKKLSGHTNLITDIAISTSMRDPLNPDSRGELLSSAEDRTIRLWNIKSGCCLHVFRGLEGPATSIALCGNHLVSMGGDNYLRAWDVNTHKPVLKELITIENATIRQFDGSKVLLSRDDDFFVFDIFENTYDSFFTGSVPFCLLPHRQQLKTCSDIIYMKGENIITYSVTKNEIISSIPAGEHCKPGELRGIYANERFIVTFDKYLLQLWDRKERCWVRTLLDIEHIPAVKEFCRENEGGAFVTTESLRHLAIPVRYLDNEIALFVLSFN